MTVSQTERNLKMALRKKRTLTNPQLSEKLGVSDRVVVRILSMAHRSRIDKYERVAKAMGLELIVRVE